MLHTGFVLKYCIHNPRSLSEALSGQGIPSTGSTATLFQVLNGAQPSFHFIDCHQGRWVRLPGRAFAHDLGCYEKWAATLFDEKTRAHFFAGYLEARPGENLSKLLRLTNQARQRLVLRRQKRKRQIHQKKQHLDPTFKVEPLDPKLIFNLLNTNIIK